MRITVGRQVHADPIILVNAVGWYADDGVGLDVGVREVGCRRPCADDVGCAKRFLCN